MERRGRPLGRSQGANLAAMSSYAAYRSAATKLEQRREQRRRGQDPRRKICADSVVHLCRVADNLIQRELRNAERLGSRNLAQREIHIALSVFENPQGNQSFCERSRFRHSVFAMDAQQNQHPRTDLPDTTPVDIDPGFSNPLHQGTHTRRLPRRKPLCTPERATLHLGSSIANLVC